MVVFDTHYVDFLRKSSTSFCDSRSLEVIFISSLLPVFFNQLVSLICKVHKP